MENDYNSRAGAPELAEDDICWEFQRTGQCKFGKRCRYSHELPPDQQKQELPAEVIDFFKDCRLSNATPNFHGKLREWKKLLSQGSTNTRPPPATIARFFTLALELMSGDVGSSQDVIKHLASERGLSFVKDVLERHVQMASQTGLSLGFWNTEVKPLFRLITHPRVIDSAVLEQEVALIYNFILGVGGRRMKHLFEYLVNLASSWPGTPAQRAATMMPAVELMLAVLAKILDCNTVNIVNEAFPHFSEQLAKILTEMDENQVSLCCLQATKYVNYIRRRIQTGKDIVPYGFLHPPVTRETFVLRPDLPGVLSAEGPRHDNDFDDMSRISILPTREEIMSPRAEYLPTRDSSTWHISGIRGRLDREFRFLREDTVGQLRDTVRHVLEQMKKPNEAQPTSRTNLRTYTYEDPTPINLLFSKNGGLELLVQCRQLPSVNNLNAKDRESWWQQSRRLQAGALACLIDASGSVTFFVVSLSTLRSKEDEQFRPRARKAEKQENGQPRRIFTLSDDTEFLYVTLQLIDRSDEEVRKVLEWYRAVGATERNFLVEFPGVLLDSFKYTLVALQEIYKKPDVPFGDILAPPSGTTPEVFIEPPMFARRPGFMYTAHCIEQDLVISPNGETKPEELLSRSSLDYSQSMAVLNSLSRELSLVQGPPGTGKSYTGEKIIQILLQNKEKAKLGPILCVCYTNHALDQLLEHLLDSGIKKVIRIGSRSKSERMANLNLKSIVKAFDKTKCEKAQLGQAEGNIKRVSQEILTNFRELATSQTPGVIKDFLRGHNSWHHDELYPPSEDDWVRVSYKTLVTVFDTWLTSGHEDLFKHRPVADLQSIKLSEMSNYERRILYHDWLSQIREPIVSSIVDLHSEYAELFEQREKVGGDVRLRCLQEAGVIGVTTTGLAKNIGLLRRLRSKVMICEEAGEVLEAHILTALLPSLEQAILIGDHLQLRPQINNYDLQSTNPEGEKYSLDLSLFERLVQPAYDTDHRVLYSSLETQRRMHPSISALIRSTLYPALQDSKNVNSYPEVKGMRQRLFWLHHEHLEAGASAHDPLSTSHSNDFEVEMTTALVSHLVRQGEYQNGQIAVLTPYLGQLHKLRRRMSSIFEICINDKDAEELEAMTADTSLEPQARVAGISKSSLLKTIRVATVDNFQGEEAEVVVISLVRSNPQNKCGFLSTTNRINVLLSRAKHGMYIIGNSNTYRSVSMWQDVIGQLDAEDNIGSKLGLRCPRHPRTPIFVSEPDDFAMYAPESGCFMPCQMRLACGHSCTGRCHSEILHKAVKCLEPCPRSLNGCDHPCPRKCGEVCPIDCRKIVKSPDIMLACGHKVDDAPCFQLQNPSLISCKVRVVKTVPGCGHRASVKCSEDVNEEEYMCETICEQHLVCGHDCQNPCWNCTKREQGNILSTNHGCCKQLCGKKHSTCRHSCIETCHDGTDCDACKEPCEVRCSHSKCGKLCHEPCAPCAEEKCQSCCPHSECTMPCSAPCDWIPCSRRCDKTIQCGHQCPSICGEKCPDAKYCQECASDEIKSSCVDFLEMKVYGSINLNLDPCIFPDCGHFLTVASMDGQMDMASHYVIDWHGHPIGITKNSEPFSMEAIGVRTCAMCRGSLQNIARYGRVVRRATLDEATKKFISWSNTKYATLASKLLAAASDLSNAEEFHQKPHSSKPKRPHFSLPRYTYLSGLEREVKLGRYGTLIGLWKEIDVFANEVRKEEQPFQRVADLVRFTNRQKKTAKEFHFDDSVIQVKGFLLASLLRLKCEICIMSDFFFKGKGTTSLPEDFVLDLTEQRKECEQVIKLAQKSMYPKEVVQALILKARLCAIGANYCANSATAGSEVAMRKDKSLMESHGLGCLELARGVLKQFPSTNVFEEEVESLQQTFNDGFCRPLTLKELRAVFKAMSTELRGTGHWYACENGHYFTIGECGMPMQEARCPDCGARIGGRDHELLEGVTAADEIEELGRGNDEVGN